jgi:hypothetical protein
VTAEHADRDQIDCQRWAAREASLRAEGFYGPGYGPYGPFASRRFGPEPVNRSGYHMLDEARLADFCMHAKGYQRVQELTRDSCCAPADRASHRRECECRGRVPLK